MSVALTEAAVVERRKTVSRRLGWRTLTPGTPLTLVRKSMGRHNRVTGITEPLVRIAEVEVVSVRRERLDAITYDDVIREGFTPADLALWRSDNEHDLSLASRFVAYFCEHMRCEPSTEVTRIEWAYTDAK